MAGTLTISTLSDGTNSTSSTNCIQGSAKAWVKWSGTTGTTSGSYNVSSVTRSSAGLYVVNFTTAMSSTNYAINISASSVSGSGATDAIVTTVSDSNNGGDPTASLFKLSTRSVNGTLLDPTFCFASVFA